MRKVADEIRREEEEARRKKAAMEARRRKEEEEAAAEAAAEEEEAQRLREQQVRTERAHIYICTYIHIYVCIRTYIHTCGATSRKRQQMLSCSERAADIILHSPLPFSGKNCAQDCGFVCVPD
jgi:hypothetical protein